MRFERPAAPLARSQRSQRASAKHGLVLDRATQLLYDDDAPFTSTARGLAMPRAGAAPLRELANARALAGRAIAPRCPPR